MEKNLESKDQEIGYHKGALSTLSKEREELTRILNIVEQLMQMHVGALQEHGVDVTAEQAKDTSEGKKKPPIEDILGE
mgnify:CR=1 FL=1